jgi:hypothetical protein
MLKTHILAATTAAVGITAGARAGTLACAMDSWDDHPITHPMTSRIEFQTDPDRIIVRPSWSVYEPAKITEQEITYTRAMPASANASAQTAEGSIDRITGTWPEKFQVREGAGVTHHTVSGHCAPAGAKLF